MTSTENKGRLRQLMQQSVQRGEVFAQECPSRGVLINVTSRWGVLVLVALLDGKQRFNELKRKIGGISDKMLSQTLQVLEADGFVLREVLPVVPPHVDYSLSPTGIEVAHHVEALTDWIEENLGEVLAAREKVQALKGVCTEQQCTEQQACPEIACPEES